MVVAPEGCGGCPCPGLPCHQNYVMLINFSAINILKTLSILNSMNIFNNLNILNIYTNFKK